MATLDAPDRRLAGRGSASVAWGLAPAPFVSSRIAAREQILAERDVFVLSNATRV